MDKLKFVKSLDKMARILRRLGLYPITRLGRHLLKAFLGTLSVDIDGLHIMGSIEHRGYLNALREGKKEAFMTDLFKRVVKPGMVVLDIGAYLGQYTLLAARQTGPKGKVYSFEPDPLNFLFLVQNIQRNDFSDRVIAVPKAVSDKRGEVAFFLSDRDRSRSSAFLASTGMKTTVVEGIALDEFFGESVVVDVIKMDIEGGELHALKGMERTLARASSRLTMFVECNPTALRAAGGSANALIDRLEELGLRIEVIDEASRRLNPVSPNIEATKYVNLYCTRSKA